MVASFFSGDEHTLAWANLNLRCAERVLIKVGEFPAQNFEELFEGVYELPWLDYIEKDCAFPVKGYSLDSQLHSIPDCQSIIKKAIVKSLSESYGITWFEERGARCQVQFSIVRDIATLYLDTSGAGLHKRGYRANANEAPLPRDPRGGNGQNFAIPRKGRIFRSVLWLRHHSD